MGADDQRSTLRNTSDETEDDMLPTPVEETKRTDVRKTVDVAGCAQTARLRRRSNTCSGLMDSSSWETFSVFSSSLDPTRGAVDGGPKQRG